MSNVQNRFYKKTDKTDFDDLTTNGYYYGVLTSNTPDGTTTENWVVEVQAFDNNPLYVFQRATKVSDKRIFTRHREGKTIGWKNWEILATKSDLIQDGIYDVTTDSNGSVSINSIISGVTINHFVGAYFYDETAEANVLTRIHLYKKYVFAVAINPDSNAKYTNRAMKMHIWYRKS